MSGKLQNYIERHIYIEYYVFKDDTVLFERSTLRGKLCNYGKKEIYYHN